MTRTHANVGRSLHFMPYIAAVAGIVLLVFLILYQLLGRYTPEDLAAYKAMLSEANGDSREEQKLDSLHTRQNVQKDAYIARKNAVMQFRLKSKDAQLSLQRAHGDTDIIETMEDVTCWLQESLLYRFGNGVTISSQDLFWPSLYPAAVALHAAPEQRLLYLEANKATYDYSKEKFFADDARIWRYVVPGHTLTEEIDKQKAMISGVAEHVVITFGTNGIMFSSVGFKAAISLPGGKS